MPRVEFTTAECLLAHQRLNRILDRLPKKARRLVMDEVSSLYWFFEVAKGYARADPPRPTEGKKR